jgi:glycosyltransferase involved in cell wall biosynthesis
MNISIVHPYRIHANAVGGSTRVFELAQFLARRRHRVAVFSHADRTINGACPVLADLGVEQHVFDLPVPSRLTQARWLFDESKPYYVHWNVNPAMASALAAAAPTTDVVHLELGYMAPAIAALPACVVRGLAEQEVMPLMLERLERVDWRERSTYERVAPLMRRRAIAFDRRTLPAFDLLYGINEREAAYLRDASGRDAAVLPHVVSVARFAASLPDEQDRATVMFVGNFQHRPNVHAARWFVQEIWPQVVSRVPFARCEFVGPGLDTASQTALTVPGVAVSGYQPDLAACYRRATVVINPVISGGGMRGKVLEAMASAAAVVSTSVGLEGIAASAGQHCIVADDAASFADGIVSYVTNPVMRRAHGDAARRLISQNYDAPAVFARLESDYQRAVDARRQGLRTSA